MIQSLFLLATLLGASTPDGQDSGSRQTLQGPSFRCTGTLSPTEALICSDVELSAYDRAVAFAYSHKWYPQDQHRRDQLAWLKDRNACGGDRSCVLSAYSVWVGGLSILDYRGDSLTRTDDVPRNADDLILGTLQSPTGEVKPLGDSGNIMIQPVGGGWYLFGAIAEHFYDPHDGLGPNVSTAESGGMVRIVGGKGTYADDPADPNACAIEFTKLSNGGWRLDENGQCGGVGATLSGVYR